jgi:hypothetical protein
MPNAALETTPPRLKSPDALVNRELADAYRAWLKVANGRFAPTRREVSPKNMKPVLATAFLLDVIDGGADFRLSLGGDKILRFLMNRLSPGMRLSEVAGTLFHERALRMMRYCVDTMLPVAAGPSQAALEGREFFSTEVLVLPLSDDGETVTSLLGAIHLAPLKPVEEPSQVAGMPNAFPQHTAGADKRRA